MYELKCKSNTLNLTWKELLQLWLQEIIRNCFQPYLSETNTLYRQTTPHVAWIIETKDFLFQ